MLAVLGLELGVVRVVLFLPWEEAEWVALLEERFLALFELNMNHNNLTLTVIGERRFRNFFL